MPRVSTILGSSSGFGFGLTLSVRSKASSPRCTDSSVASDSFMHTPEPMHFLRKRLRVISMVLARWISWSRVRSGISPICVRYMRTGSSIFSGRPPRANTGAVSSSSRVAAASASGLATSLVSSSSPGTTVAAASASSSTSTPESSSVTNSRSILSGGRNWSSSSLPISA